MKLIDILIIVGVALVVGLIIGYICRTRKKGIKCIGCPERTKCCANCNGDCCDTYQEE